MRTPRRIEHIWTPEQLEHAKRLIENDIPGAVRVVRAGMERLDVDPESLAFMCNRLPTRHRIAQQIRERAEATEIGGCVVTPEAIRQLLNGIVCMSAPALGILWMALSEPDWSIDRASGASAPVHKPTLN